MFLSLIVLFILILYNWFAECYFSTLLFNNNFLLLFLINFIKKQYLLIPVIIISYSYTAVELLFFLLIV